jgi:hypothetical protein
LTLKVKCAQKAPIFTFYQVSQEFQVNVVVQGLKVPREYKVNLEKLERLISGGGKRPVQILELHWYMKVRIQLLVSCHREFSIDIYDWRREIFI